MSRDLAEIQRGFRDAVLGNSADGLAITPQPRIAVYRNTVQGSLTDVLATAFPVVKRIVGEAFFAALARRFIAAAPPRVPQLSSYGSDFPAFVAADDVAQRLPYLADVARLEWARGECYFAADAPALDTAKLARLSPGQMEQAVLRIHPATRLVVSAYPIFRIWEVNQPEVATVPRVDMGRAEHVLVSRRGHHVATRAITGGDALFVSEITAGKTLGAAAGRAQSIEPAFDLQVALEGHFINCSFRD